MSPILTNPTMALIISCSPLVEGAWEGRLVHLAGLDVVGSTAGSLARLTQDREFELWEKRRIVRRILDGEVRPLSRLGSSSGTDPAV